MEKTTREIVTTTIDTQHCDDLTPVSNKGCRLSPQLTTNNSSTFLFLFVVFWFVVENDRN
jgi:hypothetical protein